MEFKNGRTTYENLKQKFDRTVIRHFKNEDGTARTVCLLASEGSVFVGISKFSNRTFVFSKKKGRTIAQGRAEHAYDVFTGKADKRTSKDKRREELSYIIISTEGNTIQEIIDTFVTNDEA